MFPFCVTADAKIVYNIHRLLWQYLNNSKDNEIYQLDYLYLFTLEHHNYDSLIIWMFPELFAV